MKNSFDDLFNLNPRLSTSISFILGLVLIDSLSTPQQNMLGNWIILLGQTILTNASAQNVIEQRITKGNPYNINSKEVKCIYDPIYYDIDKITQIVKSVYPTTSVNDIDTLCNMIKRIDEELKEIKKRC